MRQQGTKQSINLTIFNMLINKVGKAKFNLRFVFCVLTLISHLALLFSIIQPAHGILLETLPKGVISTQFRYGTINNLSQSYGADGKLRNRKDVNFINFDARTLLEVKPDAEILIQTLNTFGTQMLGEDINFGTVVVNSRPRIDYKAAVFAYGVTSRWSLALAVPVVHYSNNITLDKKPGNLDYYRSQFGGYSEILDKALNVNLIDETKKYLLAKEYHVLEDKDQTFVGDVELHSFLAWSLMEFPAIFQFNLILPTGPKDDADDLLSLDLFHHTEIKNFAAIGISFSENVRLKPFVSLLIPLPESLEQRVPLSERDILPAKSQKEGMERLRGITASLGAEIEINFYRYWSLLSSYQFSAKAKDSYTGIRGSRYDLLEKNTDGVSHEISLTLGLFTIEEFLRTKKIIPISVALTWSDIIAGKNVNREQTTVFAVSSFF